MQVTALRCLSSLALVVAGCLGAAAQTLPEGPVALLDGRLTLGGEAALTIGEPDESGYFNYTDYEHNALRMFRVAGSAVWRPLDRVALVGELRSEDLTALRAFAAYIQVRPFADRPFDIQAGRIPPAFGAFGRRGYDLGSGALGGYPLAYQYLTALRPDAVPAVVGDLLAMRARGWRASYPVGAVGEAPGVPLVSAFRWDTGVQARWRGSRVDAAVSVTTGTLSNPRLGDDNGGKQLSGRVALTPAPGLVLGASAARGRFVSSAVADLTVASAGTGAQTAWGADAEYSRDHWLVRGELVWTRWNVPFGDRTARDLDAVGSWAEARYRFTPRLFAAGRIDRLGFSTVDTPLGRTTWDAPVRRVEANAGVYLQRHLVARLIVQHNLRDGGRVRRKTFVSGQLAYWF